MPGTKERSAPAESAPADRPAGPSPRRTVRFLILLVDLVLLGVAYTIAHDVLYQRLLHRLAQRTLNLISSTSVESIERVEASWEGNLVLHRPVVSAARGGSKHLFYRAERIEIAFDGNPVIDDDVIVMRVDLFHPEIFVRREADADWNILWALKPAPEPPAPEPAPAGPPRPSRAGFPRNGVHVHDGIVHVTFVGEGGRETVWDVSEVNGVFTSRRDGLHFGPLAGVFYGGRIQAQTLVPSVDPFAIDMKLDIRGADVARMVGNMPWIKRQVTGGFDMVLSATSDQVRTGLQPVAAGRVAIRGGKIWDLPPFVAVLAAFALTPAEDMIIDESHVEFTLERTYVRIDRMDFLGRPLSLFGSGRMDVDGQNLEVTLVPRLGKSLNDIVPIAGGIVQALLDLAKGAIMPMTITGSFWNPQFSWAPDAPVSEGVKELMDKAPPPPK